MQEEEPSVTPERFSQGRTFLEYLDYLGSEANLLREGSDGGRRRDFSEFFRARYDATAFTEAQQEALQWLSARPDGPAKLLVIAEDWSSDCRRDVPTLARLAEAARLELRIFERDGQRTSHMHPDHSSEPDANGDLMAQFLNHKNGEAFQSIPVAAFFTRHFQYLYHYTEYPAIYHKDLLLGRIRAPRPGETPQEAQRRFSQEFADLQASPLFRVWASAAVDEIISGLHRRLAFV